MTEVLRTPDSCFSALPEFPFSPHYAELDWVSPLRMHYLDEGPRQAPVVLLLHGEPSWSYLYRKMIPPLVAGGLRCVAPDLIGFGRSDKPAARGDYTYAGHLDWLRQLVDRLELDQINLFCQDWGGLLGLRLVAEQPQRFATVCAANTILPTAQIPAPKAFLKWREFSQTVPTFPTGTIIQKGCARPVSEAIQAAYDAPYPDSTFQAGARQFPALVPVEEGIAEVDNNRRAWQDLKQFERPFLTLFADQDPIMAGAEQVFQRAIPGAQGQPHAIISNAGHFIQEDAGEELAERLLAWLEQR